MSTGVPILLYHRVGPLDGSFIDRYTVSPSHFATQMQWLHRKGWRAISLNNLLQRDDATEIGRRFVITFDDGFASNREFAWPILARHEFPSATFVVTDMIGGVNSWDGRARANYPLLTAEELRSSTNHLHAIYPHSVTHADLTRLEDSAALRRELKVSKEVVESVVGGEARILAYPRGSWNWDVIDAARSLEYVGACTCLEGLNTARTHPFLLRRVEIHDGDLGWRLQLKLRFGRDLWRWPPSRPAIVSIAGNWMRNRMRAVARRRQRT